MAAFDAFLTAIHTRNPAAWRRVISWTVVAGVGPLVVVFVLRGWDDTLRNGDAFIYAVGLAIAVLYERHVARDHKWFSNDVFLKDLVYFIVAAASVSLCLWFAVEQGRGADLDIVWLKLLVLYCTFIYLGCLRHIGTPDDPARPVVDQAEQVATEPAE
ncbi:MAG: hypothetical protein ACXVKA_07045 [Acidimicrobiia bacterium]